EKQLERLMHHTTGSTLIDVTTDGGRPETVIMRELQFDPRKGSPWHVAFMRLNMRQTLRTTVSIILSGESPAARMNDRMLLQTLDRVEIEALPYDLPAALHV